MTVAAQTSAPLIKVIWSLGKRLGMSEADIRAILFRETSKESMRECSSQELNRVILSMRNIKEVEEQTGNRATKKQAWKIHELEKSLEWQDEPKRLQAFLKKYYGVERPEWLTTAQAWKAIESLKKVAAKA